MRAEIEAKGHDELLKMLDNMKDGKRDEAEKKALKAAGDIVVPAVKALPRPRSKVKRKGQRGHLLDKVQAKEPAVMNGEYGIEVGFFKKNTYYARFVEEGTSSQAAQPFLLPTHRRTENEQLDAMMEELREGLGLYA